MQRICSLISDIINLLLQFIIENILMPEGPIPPYEEKLQLLQNRLQNASESQQALQKFIEIRDFLQTIKLQDIYNMKDLIVKHLKPLTRDITNFNYKQLSSQQKTILQSLLLVIIEWYCKAARFRFEVLAFQVLNELLQRNSDILKKQQQSNVFLATDENILDWVDFKNSLSFKYSYFYYKCINMLMETLSGIEIAFTIAGLNFIKQYIQFISKMSPVIRHHKLLGVVSKSIQGLQQYMITSGTLKQAGKQLSIDLIHGVSQAGSRLCCIISKIQYNKKFELLASIYGVNMLSSQSIQRKLNGLKIINKQSQLFYRPGATSIKQQQYITWLYDNKIIDLILEQSSITPILKHCNYILRIMFKRRCLSQARFIKILDFIQQTDTQNRQIMLRNMQLESIRLEYSQYVILVQRLKKKYKYDYYQEDLFTIYSQCIRYCTNDLLRQFIDGLQKILLDHIGKFKNQRIQYRCLKCYAKAIARLMNKQQGNIQAKKKQLFRVYDLYFKDQFTQLGLLVFKNIFEQLPDMSQFSKIKTACVFISSKNIIKTGLQTIKNNSTNPGFNQDIQSFLCTILRYASDYYGFEKTQFKSQIFIQSINSPKIFQKLMGFSSYNIQDLYGVFEQLLNKFSVETIPFDCIKAIFLRINNLYIRQIKEYGQQPYFEVLSKVSSLKGIDNIKYLLRTAKNSQNRTILADFIATLYTSFTQFRISEGQQQLQKYLKQIIQMVLMEQNNNPQADVTLLGYLALIQALMMATQVLGVGKYRPHNSLVPTSTVQIKIMNDVTYGNDVAQSYWKKVSSNITLFDLLEEIREKFRCSACQITLQEGERYWPEKWNGLTLQQLNIDDKLLKAIKSSKQKIRKEKLLQMGELSLKARKVFQDIYNTFAVQGKMGKKQCANFVAGVTKTSSSVYDSRVIDFLKQYDTDQDDKITLQNFLKFYRHHCAPERDQIVWKNLHNMRYRKDLKKYDDPVEIVNENLLFRSLLYKNEKFYNLLFSFSQLKEKQLQQRSKRLLLRLPTFPKTLQSVKSELNLIEKNCFQTQYLLIAIQSKLHSSELSLQQRLNNHQQFIKSGDYLRIFQMMLRIDSMENATQDQKKCLAISLQILRSLLKVPDLKDSITSDATINISLILPETYLFKKLAQNAFKNIEIDIFEASLGLQMTQNQNSIVFCLEGIFHDEIGIRYICCNYIFALYLLGKVTVNLFQIEQKNNCQFWFQTLVKICKIDKKMDFSDAIKLSINKIRSRQQTIQKIQDDRIIFGNFSIIQSILAQKNKNYEDISSEIIQISHGVLSGRSRKLIYSILSHFDPYFAIQFVNLLISSVQPVKEVEPKKFYIGLKNLGSTCYMNSVLQVLFCVQQFKNLILSLKGPEIQLTEVKGKKIYDNTICQLQKMYTYLLKSTKKYYNPQQFCLTIKVGNSGQPIDPKIQQDAHEFVGKFLDKIQKQIQKTDKIDIFRQLLQGNTVTQVLCKKCSNKINRQQKFCQLSLAVQNINSLQQSFEKFIVPEQIQDYFCSSCNFRVQKIQKSTLLNKLPKLLTINLQRIVYDLEVFMFKKIDTSFSFPQQLNVYNYINKQTNLTFQDCNYKLKSIIVHSGTSQSGHYYSIIKIQNLWYKFNDQTVTKMQQKDIQHQCFGGIQSKQQWSDDLKFSTNAYMLFYQKIQPNNDRKQVQINYSLSQPLLQQINLDNQKFYKQIQTHQQSIFIFANQIFEKFVPTNLQQHMKYQSYQLNWNQDPNLAYYQAIYQFSINLLKFSTVFYDVKQDIMFKIGQNLFKLFFLLPQKSYSFLTELKIDKCIDNLCLHNDETIRNIYKYLLNKSLHVFYKFYQVTLQTQQQGAIKVLKLIDCLFAFIEDQRLYKNFAKSFNYFDFWKTCCEYIPILLDYLLQHDMLFILLDMLMANESPYADKQVKRKQVPQYTALPILQIINYLSYRKKNLKGYINPITMFQHLKYYDLTQKQKKILGNINFYSKLVNNRLDNGQLGILIARICEKDYEFSKQLVQVLLKGINNVTNPDTAIAILNNIKSYLAINDQFTECRLKWILGLPQLRMGDQLVYGLTYQDESLAYQYISSLYFIKTDKQDYKSALSILYQNHSTYNSFSLQGVQLLLNLMCNSQRIFAYIMKLPAPTYIYKSYLDWIDKYIRSFKDSYFMQERPNDKKNIINKLIQMYNYLAEKAKSDGFDLPVNKKIIGRNRQLYAVQSTYTQDYKMTLWAHLTYTLPNQPLINTNNSLPKQLFKFANPQGYAKYFISIGKPELQHNQQLKCELSVYTLQIQAKHTLKLKFKIKQFTQQIYVYKGKVFINFGYQEVNEIKDVVQVQVIRISQDKLKQQQSKAQSKYKQNNQYISDKQMFQYYPQQAFGSQNACKNCTYINRPGDRQCDMCQSILY